MKKLIKSYKFWSTLAGAVGLLFVAINDTLGITINVQGVEQIILSICSILVVFGIVQKPKDSQETINKPTDQPTKQENDNNSTK